MLKVHLTSTTSTNDAARQWALRHPDRPVLVSARVQTAGRGRGGRTWQSPSGGAWFSVAWPISGGLSRYAAAPLRVGLALAEQLDRTLIGSVLDRPPLIQIKWPNDLLLRERKVAGILCETTHGGETPSILVVGVGINVNVDPGSLGDRLAMPATSLRQESGSVWDLSQLIEEAGDAVGQALASLGDHGLREAERAAIESRLAWRDQPVRLRSHDEGAIDGKVLGITGEGHLKLRTPSGLRVVHSGDVIRLRPGSAAECFSSLLQEQVSVT